jgi:hypothetical protein
MSEEPRAGADKQDDGKLGVASLVPEAYYDLIARVPAGTLLVLFAAACLLRGFGWSLPQASAWLSASSVPVLIAAGAVIGIGGLTGILISPIASICRRFYWKKAWVTVLGMRAFYDAEKKILNRAHLELPKDKSLSTFESSDFEGIDRWIYDYIQDNSPLARALLPKMRAEADLCSYLSAAFLLLPVVHLVIWASLSLSSQAPFPHVSWPIVLAVLIWYAASWTVAAVLCFAGAYRTQRLILRMVSMFMVIVGRQDAGRS